MCGRTLFDAVYRAEGLPESPKHASGSGHTPTAPRPPPPTEQLSGVGGAYASVHLRAAVVAVLINTANSRAGGGGGDTWTLAYGMLFNTPQEAKRDWT